MEHSKVTLVRMVDGGHKYLLAKPAVPTHERPKVFIHGMAGFAAYLIPMMEYFAARGYVCFAPDITGHGERQEESVKGMGVLDYVLDVNDFIDRIVKKENDRPLTLVGHSMGGIISAKLAEGRSDIAAAVLITPAPPKGVMLIPGGLISFTFNDVLGLTGRILGGKKFVPSRAFLESLFADPKASKDIIDLWESRRVSNESFLVAMQLGFSQIAVDANKINSPMLVIGARKDKLVHHTVAQKTHEYYRADYHLLEHLGHMCPFESGWELTADVIAKWLRKKK